MTGDRAVGNDRDGDNPSWQTVLVDVHTQVNRDFWDEVTPHHAGSDFYDLNGFVDDPDSLGAIELAEIGDVAGRTICHLQCHIGLDSLSLARRDAIVTGVDFSAASVDVARSLSERTGIAATFVEADATHAADALDAEFDIVFTTRGVLMWIGDLRAWAASCEKLLRPGGFLYLLDIHPFGMIIEQQGTGLALTGNYFGDRDPSITVKDASYAVSDVGLTNQETHEWIHSVGNVVSALADAGLVIEFLHEHPSDDHVPTTLSADDDPADPASASGPPAESIAGLRPGVPQLPALYSIRAGKPS